MKYCHTNSRDIVWHFQVPWHSFLFLFTSLCTDLCLHSLCLCVSIHDCRICAHVDPKRSCKQHGEALELISGGDAAHYGGKESDQLLEVEGSKIHPPNWQGVVLPLLALFPKPTVELPR